MLEMFPRKMKKKMPVKFPKGGTGLECKEWKNICVFLAIDEIIFKIIMEGIKKYLESSIKREQSGFCFGSSCTDNTAS